MRANIINKTKLVNRDTRCSPIVSQTSRLLNLVSPLAGITTTLDHISMRSRILCKWHAKCVITYSTTWC